MITRTGLIFIVLLFFAFAANAEPSCDFLGISVGDKITQKELMEKLKIKNYKLNHRINLFDRKYQNIVGKYNFITEMEMIDDIEGNYCDISSCKIVYELTIGNNIIANAYFGFDKNQSGVEKTITAITVSFNSSYWDDVKNILSLKYGKNRTIEQMPMWIANPITGKGMNVQREILEYSEKGKNQKTGEYCTISGTNFDIIFEHNNSIGVYHSVVDIAIISKNF